MQKTVSLKELPNKFIDAGMNISELCDYLNISTELVEEWERTFNLFPEKGTQKEKVYSKKRIKDFIKIKDFLDRGMPLYEIRRKLFKLPEEPTVNPFEKEHNLFEFKPEMGVLEETPAQEAVIKPFLTQINKANERIGELILEKAKIVEETAIEKANLMSELKTLEAKNIELLSEKDNLFAAVKEKEEQIKKSQAQEATLAETLKISQEMLQQKEEELINIQDTIDAYERELQEKDVALYRQSLEIDELLEKQNRKWWHVLRDIFF